MVNTDLFLDNLDLKRLRTRRFWYVLALALFVASLIALQPLLFLAALEQCLLAQGCKATPGAGVAAANATYAATQE